MKNNNNTLPQVSVRIEPTDIVSSLERAIDTQNKPPTAQIINLSIIITPQQQRSDGDE